MAGFLHKLESPQQVLEVVIEEAILTPKIIRYEIKDYPAATSFEARTAFS
ncbi:MAG: hypothetical protein ACI9LE_001882 [Paraglaciecola sp.]